MKHAALQRSSYVATPYRSFHVPYIPIRALYNTQYSFLCIYTDFDGKGSYIYLEEKNIV